MQNASRQRLPVCRLLFNRCAIALLHALVLITAASAQQLDADHSLKELSLEQLGDITVTTVSKAPEKIQVTPAAVYVLTQEDIRRSGATSIPDVLRLVPGVEIARIDSNQWSVGIRGFESAFSRSVLVLIDGRNVYTPLFAGVYWDVQNLMLEDVERIEIIRGPGGTIWGANAVNGVINIITKSARNTHGAVVSTGGGNVDQGAGSARYGGSVGKNFDYRIYASGFIRGPEFHPDNDRFDNWRQGRVGFRADWSAGDANEFSLEGDTYSGQIGSLTNISFFSPPSKANIDNKVAVSGGDLLWNWRRKISAASDFQLQIYFDRTNRQNVQFGETRNTFDIDFIDHVTLPKHQNFIWGAGVRVSPSNFIQTQPTVDFLPHQQTDSIFSGFLQDEIPIVEHKISLTLGSKLEHNNFSGFEYQPSVRLQWTPSDRQTIWAAATRAVSTPSRIEEDLALTELVVATPPPLFIEIAGVKDFGSEKMLGYEVGYRNQVSSRFYIDISSFFNNYSGVLSLGAPTVTVETNPAPTHVLLTVPWANGLIGNTDGVEIAPDWKVREWWHLKGSYSYLQMHLKDKRGITDATTAASDTGSSPHHEVVVQSLFNLPGKFEFDPTFRYVSALPAQIIKAYSTMDAHFGWHFSNQFEVSVVGQNLFRPNQMEFGVGVPNVPNVGVKRAVYATVTWRRE